MLCLFIAGAAMTPVVSAVDEPLETLYGIAYMGGFTSTDLFYLEEGLEIKVELVPDSEDCDFVMRAFRFYDSTKPWYLQEFLVWVDDNWYEGGGHEEGYFIVPEEGWYFINVYGYEDYGSYPDGIGFTVNVWDKDVIFPEQPPIEAAGTTYGSVKSWTINTRNAKSNADDNAPFVSPAWYTSDIWYGSCWGVSIWQRPIRQFCAEDAFVVGGIVIQFSGYHFENTDEARELFDLIKIEHVIDGVPLESIAKITLGPIHAQRGPSGEVIWWYRRMECATFKPGELAELIGIGPHQILTTTIYPWGVEGPYYSAFELVSCSSP